MSLPDMKFSILDAVHFLPHRNNMETQMSGTVTDSLFPITRAGVPKTIVHGERFKLMRRRGE